MWVEMVEGRWTTTCCERGQPAIMLVLTPESDRLAAFLADLHKQLERHVLCPSDVRF
jgi:hypothetical protein